ncbi:hypothetical protein BALU111458_19500 [Bacillus luti]
MNQLHEAIETVVRDIIDDYGLPPCAEAVTDFRNQQNLTAPITKIDVFGVYWRKG